MYTIFRQNHDIVCTVDIKITQSIVDLVIRVLSTGSATPW